MAIATDNTTLNPGTGGDVIATEDFPVGAQRLTSDSPLTDYKLGRSKIAVGDYGDDAGDAGPHQGLPVQLTRERWALEEMACRAAENALETSTDRRGFASRPTLMDRRGSIGRGVAR